ncbi:MAG: hypothetical protein E6Q83_12825 [Thiothrix sp.]|nr:MAG: hypothetical protein E6Q83_12825 [Thiothrix sp.]
MSVLSALRVTSGQTIDPIHLVYAAAGSTLAWGFVDGMMDLIGVLINRTHTYKVLNSLVKAQSLGEFRQHLMDESPSYIVEKLNDNSLEQIQTFLRSQEQTHRPGLNRDDLQKAFYIWLIVVSASLPLIMPLILIKDHLVAFRVTQFISVWIMFAMGYKLGDWLGIHSLFSGLFFAAFGAFITMVCIALGG